MASDTVFRFLATRPADLQNKEDASRDKVPLRSSTDPETPLETELKQAHGRHATREEIVAIAERFRRTPAYVQDLAALEFDAKRLARWLAAQSDRPLEGLDLRDELRTLYGQTLGELVASAPFRAALAALADTILADSILGTAGDRRADDVAAAFKLLRLLRDAAGDRPLPSQGRLGHLVSRTTIVVSDLAGVRRHGEGATAERVERRPVAPDEEALEVKRLQTRLSDLETAHRDLSRLALDASAIDLPSEEVGRARQSIGLGARLAAFGGFRPRPDGNDLALGRADPVFTKQALAGLGERSRGLLTDLKLDLEKLNPLRAVRVVEDEMALVASRLAARDAPQTLLTLGGVLLDRNRFRRSLGISPLGAGGVEPAEPLPPDVECTFSVGIGDLLMVRQTLKAYELVEFAHVENVLEGESREREHRRLNVREEIVTVEEETETEKERDLQSTERNELQTEAERTVKSELSLEAGLQVSGSYGPSVSFSASLNASFSTTTEETQRKATSYSREVTEKTAERIRQRVREERRRRILEEIEEINRHKVDNSQNPDGPVRGIYRWLNKIFDAQVFNYGQRMLYEFVVPEPAAYFLYAFVENPPRDLELVKPDPPMYLGNPLKPSNLTRTNYHEFVSRYGVTNAPVPPPGFQTVAYFDKQDGSSEGNFGRSGKVEIPAGYEAYAATVMSDYVFTSGESHAFDVMLGGANVDCTPSWGSRYRSFGQTRQKELAIAALLFRVWSFALGIDVHCDLTTEGFAKWQHDMFDAIQQAYLQQKADYEDKLAAAAIQRGTPVLGRNPLENRRFERDELKKWVLSILTNTPYLALDSFLAGAEPVIDVDAACRNGARIRFFENAFEWNNMLYVFYPYFWGRHARWISALHLTDPDLDFAAFLKAGAARVQVPVRPGFERALAHFCQFGEIWDGNDPPLIDDDLYVPIVDEITEQLGKLDDGVPYPADSQPWEVRVPTSLVVVQDLEEIPGIRDVLTGDEIDIES